ncbi:MAG: hypothetical protein CVU87_13805 [Firmicutes bacterium HGW-Firmicutes-12]|nr:MAG: hypothetical protein CVU87_13805 [Firmicutes bacterium HGW-Firmicutes-12]
MGVTGAKLFLFCQQRANMIQTTYFFEQDLFGGGGDYVFPLVTYPLFFWSKWLILWFCAKTQDGKYIQSP